MMWDDDLRASTPTHSRTECPSTPRTEVSRPPRGTVIASFTAADSISAKSLEDLLNAPRKKQQLQHPPQTGQQSTALESTGMRPSFSSAAHGKGDDDDDDDLQQAAWLDSLSGGDDEQTIRTTQFPLGPEPGPRASLTSSFHAAAAGNPFLPSAFPDTELVDSISSLTVDNTPVRKRLTLACCVDPNAALTSCGAVARRQGLLLVKSSKIGTKRRSSREDSDDVAEEDYARHHSALGIHGATAQQCSAAALSTPMSPHRRTAGSVVSSAQFDLSDDHSPILKKRPHDCRTR